MDIKKKLQDAVAYCRETNNGQVLLNVVEQVIAELDKPVEVVKDELEIISDPKKVVKKKKVK